MSLFDRTPRELSVSHENGVALTVIVGGGGMGRETAVWAEAAGMRLMGFVDDDLEVGTDIGGVQVLGGIDHFCRQEGDHTAVIAIGSPATRARVLKRLRVSGVALARVVHPSAWLGRRVHLGEACIIGPNTTITVDGQLGDSVIVNFGAQIGHDAKIGACSFIGPGVAIAGNVTLGQDVQVGINATLVQGVHVGDGTIIGAGAVVLESLPAHVTAVGVPARIIKQRQG